MGGYRGTVQDVQLNLEIFLGPVGFQGAQGVAGTVRGGTGPTGAQGDIGTQGDVGAQGTPGIDLPGPQGAQGTPGTIGPFGNIGTPGTVGDAGFEGAQGIMGAPSPLPNGPPGVQGDVGPPGPPGPGTPGAQGTITGPPGPQGNDGEFTGSNMATAMIYRNSGSAGLFESDANPTFQLIRSRLAGGHDCGAVNISTWNQPVANSLNIQSFNSELPGEPAGFEIQMNYDGTYWFSYNITAFIEGEGVNRVISLEARSTAGTTTIAGSKSSSTVNDRRVHFSQTFLYDGVAGEQIGVYASNLNGLPNICIDMGNSSFVAKLIS